MSAGPAWAIDAASIDEMTNEIAQPICRARTRASAAIQDIATDAHARGRARLRDFITVSISERPPV
ncbi:hypothetical protein BSFA1_08630 [Burkholderia sp. SFA1]|nr:hypothetical protein BSFA1_08630 [Burkholderia sp. SFA1]